MPKVNLKLKVVDNQFLNESHILIRLTHEQQLPDIIPGQFVQVKVEGSPTTFLRRPISVNFVDYERNELWLLVQLRGQGTKALAKLGDGDELEVLLPLGNGFKQQAKTGEKILLVGGGVGVAPILYYGKVLAQQGAKPIFLIGAKNADSLLETDLFKKYGTLHLTTEDGSDGVKGFVTDHPVLKQRQYSRISVCGPTPMMKAVADFAIKNDIECEVSLENIMACGLGACLCCVQKTTRGNICVCTEGPVFNAKEVLV